jgi:hypothetical protein
MNKRNYTSIKKIINDIAIKSGNKTDFNPDDVLYMANGIAELIIPGDSFIEEIALIDIENYKGQLPANMKFVSQALYREDKPEECPLHAITDYSKKLYGTDCEVQVSLKCDPCSDTCSTKKIVMDADYDYLLKNPQWAYNHSKFFYGARNSNPNYNKREIFDEFSLMRKTTDHFFNVPYHINECITFNADSRVEYNLEYPNIVVNFKKGKVILAYVGTPIDDEGYRMIPDIEEMYDALYYSIRERLIEQKFDSEPNQNNRIALQMAEQKAAVKRKVARSALSQKDPDEWMMFIKNHWVRTIPNYKWEAVGNRFVSDSVYTARHTMKKF